MPSEAELLLKKMAEHPEYEDILDTPGLAYWFNTLVAVATETARCFTG